MENFFNSIKRIFRSLSNEISYKEALNIIKKNENVVLIDVRSKQEYEEGHLNGAISIPVYDIEKIIKEKVNKRDTIIILYCKTGARSKKAAKILKDLNYSNVYIITKGIDV